MNEHVSAQNVNVHVRFTEWQSLLDLCKDKDSLLTYVLSVNQHYDVVLICVSKKDVNCIIDILGDLLATIGFDEEYNPNEKGKIIESVIDKFTNASIEA